VRPPIAVCRPAGNVEQLDCLAFTLCLVFVESVKKAPPHL